MTPFMRSNLAPLSSIFRSNYVDLRRRGLTLLEMVAAMVLMAILFAALTSLLRCFSNQERTIQRISERYPRTQILSEMLRRDVTNARLLRQDARSLTLSGTMAQDWRTHQPTGRRAEVVYRIEVLDGEPWLMRREVLLDENSSRRAREEPVWRGVAGITLIATRETVGEQSEEGSPSSVPGMTLMPTRSRLVVERADGQPLVDLNIVHHWEDI